MRFWKKFAPPTKTYEFTAFASADILGGGNGRRLDCGDKFVMPKSASVCVAVRDNDKGLSGGWCGKALDGRGQGASVVVDGRTVSDGPKIFVDKVHVLRGSDGQCYTLIEIATEGSWGRPPVKMFTFYGDKPAEGVALCVIKSSKSFCALDYRKLGAGDKNAGPEAEDDFAAVCENDEGFQVLGDALANDRDADGDALAIVAVNGEPVAGEVVIDGVGGGVFRIAANGTVSFDPRDDFDFLAPGEKAVAQFTYQVGDGEGGFDTATYQVTVCGKAPCGETLGFDVDAGGDAIAAGTIIGGVDGFQPYAELGVQIQSLTENGRGFRFDSIVFDSDNPTGGDTDLATATQGNLLIVNEAERFKDPTGPITDPDDRALGGEIEFVFARAADVDSLVLVDAEEGGSVTLFEADGDSFVVDLPVLGDGELRLIELGGDEITRMVLKLNGSGAIDDVKLRFDDECGCDCAPITQIVDPGLIYA